MDPRNNTNRFHPDPETLKSEASQSALESAIVRALDRPPAVTVPADFAARVTARALAEPQPHPSPWVGFGPKMAVLSGILLTGTLFAFAPHATPSMLDLRFDIELVLLAELGLVGYILTRVGLRE